MHINGASEGGADRQRTRQHTATTRFRQKKRETEGACQLSTILLKSLMVNSRAGAVHTTLTDQHMHTHTQTPHNTTVPAPWANTCHFVCSCSVHTSLSVATAWTGLQCDWYVSVSAWLILTQLHLTACMRTHATEACNAAGHVLPLPTLLGPAQHFLTPEGKH